MTFRFAAVALFVALAPTLALAQDPAEPDAEGCKDTPVLTRLPGCKILRCESKEFDAMDLQIGAIRESGDAPMRTLEGVTDMVTYVCPARLSSLQIVRNAEGALKTAGFTVVFSGRMGGDTPIVTAQKGPRWVQVYGEPWNEFSGYVLQTVKVQAMAQEMTATAETLARELDKSGRVAVYGINFDTGSATLRPESDKVLSQIAAVLTANPSWSMRVEGHTDNVGQKAANLALSEQRAAAVVDWLTKHGVSRTRLISLGMGDASPVADNGSEEGRSLNRRVELVKP
jgi:outer membrane protein OmpA-like peptidoglycan-associated protein